jgi:thiamine pyrophosphate-dependent acetolactate synthase large subunit-like protein
MKRFRDVNDEGTLYGLTWALRDSAPLLCVYGETPLVRIYNPSTGALDQVRMVNGTVSC